MCGLNIDANCTAARLFKRTLWRYVASDEFNPKWSVGMDWFNGTFLKDGAKETSDAPVKLDADTRDMMNVGATASSSGAGAAKNAIPTTVPVGDVRVGFTLGLGE